eukprot:846842-Prymnesium_polylepis.1
MEPHEGRVLVCGQRRRAPPSRCRDVGGGAPACNRSQKGGFRHHHERADVAERRIVRHRDATGRRGQDKVAVVSKTGLDFLLGPDLIHREQRVLEPGHVADIGEGEPNQLAVRTLRNHWHPANGLAASELPAGASEDFIAGTHVDEPRLIGHGVCGAAGVRVSADDWE